MTKQSFYIKNRVPELDCFATVHNDDMKNFLNYSLLTSSLKRRKKYIFLRFHNYPM